MTQANHDEKQRSAPAAAPVAPPAAQSDTIDDTPKFGRLLLVLVTAVLLVVAITFASEAYYS